MGVALDWFRSYLKKRKQYVKYKHIESDTLEMVCGVPQGSVLGPLLFIIYTNDLPQNIKTAKCILFADDTTIYQSSNNILHLYTIMNSELEILNDWFRANKLSLNATKTHYMFFSRNRILKQNTNNLQIDNTILTRANTVKFLGILIDEDLTWNAHIEHCRTKICSGIYALNSSKHCLSSSNLKMLYYSLIHPYLTYGILLWGSAYKSHLQKLVTMQKKAIRCITKSRYNDHTPSLFRYLMIPNLQDLYKIELAKFVYSVVHKNLPFPLIDMYTQNNDVHSYNTRNLNNLHIKPFKVDIVFRSFVHQGPSMWYSLSETIKQSKSIGHFGSQLKKLYIKEYI